MILLFLCDFLQDHWPLEITDQNSFSLHCLSSSLRYLIIQFSLLEDVTNSILDNFLFCIKNNRTASLLQKIPKCPSTTNWYKIWYNFSLWIFQRLLVFGNCRPKQFLITLFIIESSVPHYTFFSFGWYN